MTTHAGKERGDRPGAAFAALALMLLALAIAAFVFAPPARSQGESGARYTGVASCAGSTCHGRMEGDGTVVRQDELMKWQEPSTPGGAHSRAWAVLSNNRSQFIARNLGIGDPATAQMCIGCHATAGAVAAKGAMRGSVPTEDGVGCESCHGPAGGWLASHYAGVGTSANPDAEMRQKHLANLSAGLKKLEDPVVRAGVCVDCHFGSASDGQFVTHRIMAAGHPRIAFELDLFSSLQAHHQEDADYGWRKFGAANGPHRPCPDVGGGAGDRDRAQPGAVPVAPRDRGDVPRILFPRLPQLPPPHLRSGEAGAHRRRQSGAPDSRGDAAL